MDEEGGLTFDSVKNYIIENGGKVTNHELVKHFKHQLTFPDPEKQEEAKLHFRDYINTLATLKQENGIKYVALRKKYYNDIPKNLSQPSSQSPATTTSSQIACWPQGRYYSSSESIGLPSFSTDNVVHNSNVSKSQAVNECNTPPQNLQIQRSEEFISENVPQPPPRKRTSTKESIGPKIEEKLRQLNKENDPKQILKDEHLLESVVSPGMVKERAHELDKLASEISNSDIKIKSPASVSSSGTPKRNFRLNTDDDDTSSVISLSSYRKEWTIKAAKGDYHSLFQLLKEEPKLAKFKDLVTGFTALHWAAKLGSSDIVKLIVGKYKVNPNIRSQGGYTPLHIATIFNRTEIASLLKSVYGADPSIRDYSGKRPEDYLPKTNQIVKENEKIHNVKVNGGGVFHHNERFLTRMGSLNLKMKKTSSVRGSSRVKSWNSYDSISDNMVATHQIPTSKSRKKTKKRTEQKPTQDSDSDSAYGF